jgi:peptide/nickel transport system ATP-binding protein
LDMVRIPDSDRVARSYPHQISGGMQQRALIAMALSTEPQLLILDEPTTGLDVTTQAAVLDLIRELTRQRRTAALYVTHNLGVVANLCDRVAVLYAGELLENAATADLFQASLHPYTAGLIDSVPQLGRTKSEVRLLAIPGQIPPLGEIPTGCVFAPRCPLVIDQCLAQRPALEQVSADRSVRCFRWPEIASAAISAHQPHGVTGTGEKLSPSASLLEVRDVEVYFDAGRTVTDVIRRQPRTFVKAVDGVSFSLDQSRTLGIVGESGSGKTTLARAIIGLTPRTAGEMYMLGIKLPPDLSERTKAALSQVQYVFQNPETALNPYRTVGQTLHRPLMVTLGLSTQEADARVNDLLEMVLLPPSYVDRYPAQLSGGEKQRVAIARAFATSPELLIADEPVSALDVSVQASILNLLRDLQQEGQNALILISHDLAVVGYLADQIAVMYLGYVLEYTAASRLFDAPMHPYTEVLLAAIPKIQVQADADVPPLDDYVPSQADVQRGCPFHSRCPRIIGDICRSERPPWQENEAGDRLFCHIPLDDLRQLQAVPARERSALAPSKGTG